uniref:Diphosphomevalonate decarboxylase n=1 Tax=Setaria digitata TaxID=48799 RepID=A0A915PZE4_9BILA
MNSHDNSIGHVREVEITAPINIALIKYWGKRNEELLFLGFIHFQKLMLPLNDSISLTINEVCAKTRIRIGPSIKEDSVSINGSDMCLSRHQRFLRCFGVVSETSFPIEAGLASSAAGFAAIAYGLGQIYQLNMGDIVRIARLGSGSACRSILSGLVHWKAGTAEDGTDCVCETIFSEDYWPTLRSIVLVTSHDAKEVGSSIGMQSTVETSKLLRARVDIVPEQILKLKNAFRERNFEKLAEVIMSESGQLHALCMDTMPSLKYLNDSSWYLMRIVHALNKYCKSIKVAYTFDAGPNCCLFLESADVPLVLATINKYCELSSTLIEKVIDCSAAHEYENLKSLIEEQQKNLILCDNVQREENNAKSKLIEPMKDTVKDIFLSCVGVGPITVNIVKE